MVRPDGSTICIHFKEPRWIVTMLVEINMLPEAVGRAQLWTRDAGNIKVKEEELFEDDFNLDNY